MGARPDSTTEVLAGLVERVTFHKRSLEGARIPGDVTRQLLIDCHDQALEPVEGVRGQNVGRRLPHLLEKQPGRTGLAELHVDALESLLHALGKPRDAIVHGKLLLPDLGSMAVADELLVDIGVEQILDVGILGTRVLLEGISNR